MPKVSNQAWSEGEKIKVTESLTAIKCNTKESTEILHFYTVALNQYDYEMLNKIMPIYI
jgi:hypothetical protein